MLRAILAAIMSILGIIGYPFYVFGRAVENACVALGYLPSVPPADGTEDFEEIAAEEAVVRSVEDLNVVKRWASAKIFKRQFTVPAGHIGEWLSALTVDDAGLIAAANGAGALADHLSGKQPFAGLAPVGDFEQTRRWYLDRRPTPPVRRAPRKGAESITSTEPDIEHDDYSWRLAA